MKTKAGTIVIIPQAKGCLEPPKTGRSEKILSETKNYGHIYAFAVYIILITTD